MEGGLFQLDREKEGRLTAHLVPAGLKQAALSAITKDWHPDGGCVDTAHATPATPRCTMTPSLANEVTMYGFNDPKLLSWPVGREIVQVGVGRHEVNFNFHPNGNIMVGGPWELLDPAGNVIDRSMAQADRKESKLHLLIGPVVTGVTVESAMCMTITFANGYMLRLTDDDPRYEAVFMTPGDGPIIVV